MAPSKAGVAGWLIVATLPGVSLAQIPGLPGGAGGASSLFAPGASGLPAIPPGSGSAATAAAPQRTIFGFFGLSKANLAGCKQKLCASPYGSLLNNGLAPYSTLSGGLIPTCCPTVPSASDLAALAAKGGPNGAEAVAAKIKQDEADAKARRAAVRYLSTVDCHYWPDAEVAIISALRDDRNECVRYEAALALLNGCCCNARTIEALNLVVSGSEKDGKPSETSERVRCAALAALQGCLMRYQPPEPAPPERPEPPEGADSTRTTRALDPAFRRVAYYYQALAARPPVQVVADARRTVARATSRPSGDEPTMPGDRSVSHALSRALVPRPTAEMPRPTGGPAPEASGPDQAATVPVIRPEPRAAASPRPAGRRGLLAMVGGDRPAAAPAPEDRDVSPASGGRRGLIGIIRNSVGPDPGP
jgi:hypothetical protein